MPFGLDYGEPLGANPPGLVVSTTLVITSSTCSLQASPMAPSYLPRFPCATPRALLRPQLTGSVLGNPGVMNPLWHHLDSGTKRTLRHVGKHLRQAVDANVTAVAASQSLPATGLEEATAVAERWPHIRTVSLCTNAADCGDWQLVKAINAGTIHKLQNLCLNLHGPASLTTLVAVFAASALQHLRDLVLSRCPDITDLSGLACCTCLHTLHINGCTALTDLSPIAACTQLHTLTLTRCRRVQTLAPLSACAQLQHLNLAGCVALLSLAPLSACTQLLTLDITACPTPHLAPLQPCTKLHQLLIGRRSPSALTRDLHPLSHLPLLHHLDLSRDTSLPNLTFLSHSPQLRHLSISGCRLIHDLTPLRACTHLQTLDLAFCWNLTDLAPLSTCIQLHTLNLSGCGRVSNLSPLAACTALHTLDLSLCAAVTHIHPLSACALLQHLDLGGTAVQDLTPLAACTQLRRVALQMEAEEEDSDDEDCQEF